MEFYIPCIYLLIISFEILHELFKLLWLSFNNVS